MIDRRRLILGGVAMAAPLTARAQQPRRLPAVGFVGFASADGDRPTLEAFRGGLKALGQREGATFELLAHSTDGDLNRGRELIAGLAARPVDVFLSPGPAATREIRKLTATPIVAIALPPTVGDHDLFASLARPGGAVTGFSTFGEELSAKRIELLKEALPRVATIGVLHNSTDRLFSAWGQQTIEDASRQGLRAIRLALASADASEVEVQIERLGREGGQALIVIRDFLTATHIDRICRLGTAAGIAVVGEQSEYPRAGALFSYGPDIPDLFRRAAGYVDRILKGERPGELPIQLPTVFELVVNLRSARALGLAIPPSVLIRAGEVIE